MSCVTHLRIHQITIITVALSEVRNELELLPLTHLSFLKRKITPSYHTHLTFELAFLQANQKS